MAKETPEFQWTQKSGAVKDPLERHKIFKTQIAVMHRLFKKSKTPYDLAGWHARRASEDLHLYAAFGLVSPFEYEFLSRQMVKWHEENVDQTLEHADLTVDHGGLDMPPRQVELLLKHLLTENFDSNIDLMLRFKRPVQMVRDLSNALEMEYLRKDRSESVSAVDELVCQPFYPATEVDGWKMMNKMVAGDSSAPLKMHLKNTAEALKKLNAFQLNKAIADIYDYSLDASVPKLKDGQWVEFPLWEKTPRIHAALSFLGARQLVDDNGWKKVAQMTPEQRDAESVKLKRSALSAFLCDMVYAVPDPLWFPQMWGACQEYFQKIFEKVGTPDIDSDKVAIKNEDGKDRFMQVVKVSFRKNNSVRKSEPSTPVSPNLSSPER